MRYYISSVKQLTLILVTLTITTCYTVYVQFPQLYKYKAYSFAEAIFNVEKIIENQNIRRPMKRVNIIDLGYGSPSSFSNGPKPPTGKGKDLLDPEFLSYITSEISNVYIVDNVHIQFPFYGLDGSGVVDTVSIVNRSICQVGIFDITNSFSEKSIGSATGYLAAQILPVKSVSFLKFNKDCLYNNLGFNNIIVISSDKGLVFGLSRDDANYLLGPNDRILEAAYAMAVNVNEDVTATSPEMQGYTPDILEYVFIPFLYVKSAIAEKIYQFTGRSYPIERTQEGLSALADTPPATTSVSGLQARTSDFIIFAPVAVFIILIIMRNRLRQLRLAEPIEEPWFITDRKNNVEVVFACFSASLPIICTILTFFAFNLMYLSGFWINDSFYAVWMIFHIEIPPMAPTFKYQLFLEDFLCLVFLYSAILAVHCTTLQIRFVAQSWRPPAKRFVMTRKRR